MGPANSPNTLPITIKKVKSPQFVLESPASSTALGNSASLLSEDGRRKHARQERPVHPLTHRPNPVTTDRFLSPRLQSPSPPTNKHGNKTIQNSDHPQDTNCLHPRLELTKKPWFVSSCSRIRGQELTLRFSLFIGSCCESSVHLQCDFSVVGRDLHKTHPRSNTQETIHS